MKAQLLSPVIWENTEMRMMKSQRGFTLVEVVVAIGIFAVLGVGCYRVMSGIASSRDRIDEQYTSLYEFTNAMRTIDSDLSQLSKRAIVDENAVQKPAFMLQDPMDSSGDKSIIEFTRSGVRNPLYDRKSESARIVYRLKDTLDTDDDPGLYRDNLMVLDGTDHKRIDKSAEKENGKYLVREVWTQLDRTRSAKPLSRVVLAGIKSMEIECMNDKKLWVQKWPGTETSTTTVDPLDLPYEIRLKIELAKYGAVEKMVVVQPLPQT